MMTPKELHELVLKSESAARSKDAMRVQLIKDYVGPFYEPSGTEMSNGKAFQYVRQLVASGVTGEVVPSLSSSSRQKRARVAELEDFGRRWAKGTNWAIEREKALVDSAFGIMVAMVHAKPQPGFAQHDDVPHSISAVRISPSVFGMDADCTGPETARVMFHRVVVDRAELLARVDADGKEAGWDAEAIKSMPDEDYGVVMGNGPSATGRRVVVYWEVWCPYDRLDDSENDGQAYYGLIRTVARHAPAIPSAADTKYELRKPQKWRGHYAGPYVVGGFMCVPDQPWPLSNLAGSFPVVTRYGKQAQRNAQDEKIRKVFTMGDTGTEATTAIRSATHGDHVCSPDFKSERWTVVEIPGITPEARQREFDLSVEADRALATGDAQNGRVTGAATASENVIAAQATATLDDFSETKMLRFDRGVMERVLYIAHTDSRVVHAEEDFAFVGGASIAERRRGLKAAVDADALDDDQAEAIGAELQNELQAVARRYAGDETGMRRALEREERFENLRITVEHVKQDDKSLARFMMLSNWLQSWIAALPVAAQVAPDAVLYMWNKAADALGCPELKDAPPNMRQLAKMAEEAAQAEQEAGANQEAQGRVIPPPQVPKPSGGARRTMAETAGVA